MRPLLALIVAAVSVPASAGTFPRHEARAVFDQPRPIGVAIRATEASPATKGLVLFEEAFAVPQRTFAAAADVTLSEPEHLSLKKGAGFGAWSFNDEVRFCRTNVNSSVVAKPDVFICVRDLDRDGRGEQAIAWKAAMGDQSEAPLTEPITFQPAAPGERNVRGYAGGHLYRIANRLRVAGVSKGGIELVWEVAFARPQDADDPTRWPAEQINRTKVPAGSSSNVGPFVVAVDADVAGRPLIKLAGHAPWLAVFDGGKAITVNNARFDRVFSFPAQPCSGAGATALGILTGGMAQRSVMGAVAGCDSVRPAFFEEWRRPATGL